MNVLALTPNILGVSPGQRSSIELWERPLSEHGIRLKYLPFETAELRRVLYQRGHATAKLVEMVRAYGRRIRELRLVDGHDAVFVYREAALIGPAFIERLVARKGIPIIYQLDDPLYIPYRSPHSGLFSYLKFFKKVDAICRLSKVVIVNSTHHQDYVSAFNKNIWLIPSLVDTAKYSYRERQPSEDVCLGWSGSPTTVGNVSLVSSALATLRAERTFRLMFIGGLAFDAPNPYEAQLWREETEVDDLRRMDIGLVPAPVNEWNKRKFYMKVTQYMALGIPPVATPIGSNPTVIEHGRTGFLADSPDEWVSCLRTLIDDPGLRQRMSVAAAEVAEELYSLRANSRRVVDAFRSALT